MSKNKFDLKYLGKLRNRVPFRPEEGEDGIGGIPIDWYEFNLLYHSRRPVIVECPYYCWGLGDNLMSLYGALRMSLECRTLGVFAASADAYGLLSDKLYNFLVAKSKWRPKGKRMALVRKREEFNVAMADDWVFYVNFSDTFSYPGLEDLPSSTLATLTLMNETNGFKDWQGAIAREMRWYGDTVPNTHKIVVLWDNKYPEKLNEIKQRYGKQFVFIEYGKEKAFVNDWFKENDTMLDPLFDIRLMEPGMDMRKVLLYAATNYLYKFREWARINPELLEKSFRKDEIKDLMGK